MPFLTLTTLSTWSSFGYLGGEFVAVFLMQRLPLTKYFS